MIRGKSEILIHKSREENWIPPVFMDEQEKYELEKVFEEHFGQITDVFKEIISDHIEIDVYHIAPSEKSNFHTLFTIGMSTLPMHVPEGMEELQYAELIIHLPKEWVIDRDLFHLEDYYWPIRWLKRIARMPVDYQTWVGVGHTFPNGYESNEPLSSNNNFQGFMTFVSLRMRDIVRDSGKTIRILNLIPLYEEEMEYKLDTSAEDLIFKFGKHNISDIVDVKRKNVSKKSWFSFIKARKKKSPI